jgi:hypothetical protein
MLDIHNIKNITKLGTMDFCEKFEKDHEEIVEFLENEIYKAALNGYLETKIFLSDFILFTTRPGVEIPKGDLSKYDIKKFIFDNAPLDLIQRYLLFKGFSCNQISSGKIHQITIGDSIESAPFNDELEVNWYKINQYVND